MDRGERTIQAICQEANLSEVMFHRRKKQFGHMEVNEVRRLKELELENTELKKLLAEKMLKNRGMSFVCEKAVSRARRRAYAQEAVKAGVCSQRRAFRYLGLARSTFHCQGRPAMPAEEQLRKRLLELSAERHT